MERLRKLVRPHILNLNPYSSARDDFKGKAEIYLDANENPFGSVPNGDFNRYPDPHQAKLKEALSNNKRVSPDHIFIGNGSDEAIDLLIRAFCEPTKEQIVVLPPTYGMYKVCARVNNVGVVEVPLNTDFQLDMDSLKNQLTKGSKIIFLCSPNNPTGGLLKRRSIIEILNVFEGLVVVDEAYIDFSSEPGLLELLKEYSNLVVLQTFSKAWGLAAIRLGIAYAHPFVIDILNKVKPPYNIDKATQESGIQALENESAKNEFVAKIIKERGRITKAFGTLPFVKEIIPSEANFLLVRFENASNTNDFLREKGIIVRDRSKELNCNECLRITVGTPTENDLLIQALKDFE